MLTPMANTPANNAKETKATQFAIEFTRSGPGLCCGTGGTLGNGWRRRNPGVRRPGNHEYEKGRNLGKSSGSRWPFKMLQESLPLRLARGRDRLREPER